MCFRNIGPAKAINEQHNRFGEQYSLVDLVLNVTLTFIVIYQKKPLFSFLSMYR